MNRHLAVAAVALAVLSGCGSTVSPAAPPAATPSANSGLGDSVKDAGDLPDPCTLLSDAEVTSLTGRDITQTDVDGAEADSTTRFCQWQQSGGQLAVFLSRTTEADFDTVIEGAEPVDGVGEDAFTLAGHLYVLYGTVSIDVYVHGDSDEENLDKARETAKTVIPRV
ncbi:DUF3558 family protein [Actinoplanes sp. NPDC051494]|uniref:DUF3558 family protein n=1 Tax=Actinoplanes sp. NPDC051494 TaxID=3363907 RepID=UPI0037B277F8